MSSVLDTLMGSFGGGFSGAKPSGPPLNPQDEEKRAREEFKNATDNYNNVARNTNDKAKMKEAYDRLDAATRGMGKYH